MSPEDQRQLEKWIRWCVAEFGRETALREIALPTPAFYPAWYHGSTEQVGELVRRVCTVMQVDADDLTVRFFESEPAEPSRRHRSTTVGTYHQEDGRPVIELDRRRTGNPAGLTAIIAHELAHVRLLGEGRITAREPDQEKLTDLVTVFLGMGVFNANAAYTFAKTTHDWSALPMGDLTEKMLSGSFLAPAHLLGYLTEQQLGYALACWCRLRGESDPAWAHYLDPTPGAQLKRSLAYLQHAGRQFD